MMMFCMTLIPMLMVSSTSKTCYVYFNQKYYKKIEEEEDGPSLDNVFQSTREYGEDMDQQIMELEKFSLSVEYTNQIKFSEETVTNETEQCIDEVDLGNLEFQLYDFRRPEADLNQICSDSIGELVENYDSVPIKDLEIELGILF